MLTRTVQAAGLDVALSGGLARWRSPFAVHDPAKVLMDLALALVLRGDCLADLALLRGEPELFGPVASEATVSRAIAALAGDADKVPARSPGPARQHAPRSERAPVSMPRRTRSARRHRW